MCSHQWTRIGFGQRMHCIGFTGYVVISDVISVHHFFDKTLQATNSYFTIATSPSPVQIQSDFVLIWSNRIQVLSQSTLIGWIRIQSKPNPLPFTLVDSLCGRMHLEILRSQSQGYSQHRPRSVYNATQTFSRLQDAVNSKRRELFLMIDFSI